VIANNLANVNTTGFKRSRAHFEDLLYQTVQGPSTLGSSQAQTTDAIQVGRGTRLSAVQRVDMQGSIEQTARPLDIAIEGEGYFQVQLPNGGMAYTRDGSFTVSDQGILVTAGGYALEPQIAIPEDATDIQISRTGVVTVATGDVAKPIEIGRIELARFTNAPGLQAIGENLFVESPTSGAPVVGFPQDAGMGRLLQGALESSNVQVVQEMVEMIASMRAYEVNSKAVKVGEDMSEIANGLLR
jgi:flagellar basal-body rod protein FlgG